MVLLPTLYYVIASRLYHEKASSFLRAFSVEPWRVLWGTFWNGKESSRDAVGDTGNESGRADSNCEMTTIVKGEPDSAELTASPMHEADVGSEIKV